MLPMYVVVGSHIRRQAQLHRQVSFAEIFKTQNNN